MSSAFTLVELLVVIGIIVLLAALTFPVMQGVQRAQTVKRAQAELSQLETAIETYHTKLGFYPPDNPGYWSINQLYYELMGTTLITVNGQPAYYQTLDGSAQIAVNAFQTAFGGSPPNVTGFMNSAKAGAGDDTPNAVKFLVDLKQGQSLAVAPVASTITVLGTSMMGVPTFTGTNNAQIVPYSYNSSSPKHNPKSFDLWVDIIAGYQTNRISNWSSRPIIISTTAY